MIPIMIIICEEKNTSTGNAQAWKEAKTLEESF